MKALLLFSGGADSRVMLEIALQVREVEVLIFDYGQKMPEIEVAKRICEEKRINYEVMEIKSDSIKSKLKKDRVCYDGVSENWVPARNTWMISLALGVAEGRGDIDEIWHGADMSDYEEFPDCRQEFFYRWNRLGEIALSKKIRIVCPILGWTKKMVVDYLQKNHITEYYSGYGEEEMTHTRLSGKEFSPLIIRRYSTPVLHFVAVISDDNLDTLDDIVVAFWEKKRPQESIQDWRNIAGELSDEVSNKFLKTEGLAVIVIADKMVVSSLYGDFMNHEQCRLELFSLLNMATQI